MSVSEWDYFSVDVTADFHSAFGNMNFSDIVLYSIFPTHHFSTQSPGAFYVDDLKILSHLSTLSVTSVSRMPDVPNYDQNVNVTTVITNNVAVDQVVLSYTSGISWYNVSMMWLADGAYSAVIPAQPYGTLVQYKIYANDTDENWVESSTYSYTVGDFVAPEIIAIEWKPSCPIPYVPSNVTRTNEPVLIKANVSEPEEASGLSKVLLAYRVDGGEWWNTSMSYNLTARLWTSTVPGQSNNAVTVEFFFKAYDIAGNMNTSSTYNYDIKHLLRSDINGDGKIDARDVVYVAKDFGKKGP
jgi:hypothetical protein